MLFLKPAKRSFPKWLLAKSQWGPSPTTIPSGQGATKVVGTKQRHPRDLQDWWLLLSNGKAELHVPLLAPTVKLAERRMVGNSKSIWRAVQGRVAEGAPGQGHWCGPLTAASWVPKRWLSCGCACWCFDCA